MSEDRQLHLPSKDCARYAVCSHGRGLSIMCPHCPPDARLCPKCASLIKPGDDFCSNCYDKAVGARREPQLQYTCANGHTAPTLQCKACYPWIDDGTCDCTVSANCGDAKCMVDNGVVPRDEDTEAELQPPDKDSSASCEGLSYPRTSFDGTGNGDKPGVFQPPAPAIQPSLPVLTDDDLLAGLWWMDEEYPPHAYSLWHEYVERKHEWNKYRTAVATVLRGIMEKAHG